MLLFAISKTSARAHTRTHEHHSIDTSEFPRVFIEFGECAVSGWLVAKLFSLSLSFPLVVRCFFYSFIIGLLNGVVALLPLRLLHIDSLKTIERLVEVLYKSIYPRPYNELFCCCFCFALFAIKERQERNKKSAYINGRKF